MSDALYVTVRDSVTKLAPSGEHTIGAGAGADVRVDLGGASEPVAWLRFLGHWILRPAAHVDETRVNGTPRDEMLIHLDPARDTAVTLVLGTGRADLLLGFSEPVPAPPPPRRPNPVGADPGTRPPGPQPGGARPRAHKPGGPRPAAGPGVQQPGVAEAGGPGTAAGGPGAEVRLHRIGGPMTVLGSGPGADIDVPDPGVAARHATLRRQDVTGLEIRDHGQGEPTYVRGRRIMWARLRAGDSFSIADSVFTLLDDETLRETRRARGASLVISGLSATYRAGWRPGARRPRPALSDLSIVLRSGEILAVIGPSGAGKSTFFKALLGEVDTSGRLLFSGLDLGTEAEQIRDMVAFVPQQVDLHESLTVGQVLRQAARLLPGAGSTAARRAARVAEIAEHLDIAELARTPIRSLSGGEKRRVSIGVEILGGPRLLMLDEPTSALDAGRARSVMRLLRGIADGDCTVAVVTHATDQLDGVDKVLVIGDNGRPLYYGEPGAVLDDMGETGFADLMTTARHDSGEAAARFLAGPVPAEAARLAAAAPAPPEEPPLRAEAPRRRAVRQFPVLAARELALLRARGPLALLQIPAIPALGGLLAALGASAAGLGGPAGTNGHAVQALTLLITACVFAGQSITYGDLVAQFPVLCRERRAGVSTGAVVAAKAAVFGVVAVLQAMITVGVFRLLRPAATDSLLLGADADMAVCLAAGALTAMCLGLLISAAAPTVERAVGWATATAICQVALSGGLLDLSERPVLNAISWLLPSRWATAALAASSDVPGTAFPGVPDDVLWQHRPGQMISDVGVLLVMTIALGGAAWLVLRRRLARRS
ncbi:ATP-binding cassette domain-containing protein [Actinomadura monticuli]|uniref:ATP-binding cassette domain-containing protein n=1 Tax=Actinomadura monticuli TaxID=3097367 RepID=A0ABV4Q769_9ACTN